MQKLMIKLISFADIISMTNACLGFLAIVMLILKEMQLSLSFIFIAILTDGLDGIVARKIRNGELGEYLEAMADMTSLSIGPSIFVYVSYYETAISNIYHHFFLFVTLIIFLSLSIIRLASFHIIKEKDFFIGLPASVSTIIIIILAFFRIEIIYILSIIIVISLAMVSNVRFPKPGYKLDIIAALLIILTLIFGTNFNGIAPIILILSLLLYTFFGPVYLSRKLKRKN